jgi:hypothetical protein
MAADFLLIVTIRIFSLRPIGLPGGRLDLSLAFLIVTIFLSILTNS